MPFATQVPMIEIEMPPNMNDLFGPLVYEMDIYSFKLPTAGALPHRLMVQIMKDDRTKPHFRVAAGRFYNAPTREFATIGRVLTSPTVGPFVSCFTFSSRMVWSLSKACPPTCSMLRAKFCVCLFPTAECFGLQSLYAGDRDCCN